MTRNKLELTFLFGKSNSVEAALQSKLKELESKAVFLKCFKPIQAIEFSASLHAYKNALKILSRDGLDAAKKFYSSRQMFVPQFISHDISTILESGRGLFDSFDALPDFLTAEQKTKDEKRAFYNAKMSEERRAVKLKTEMALAEQARKRQEFTQATGVQLD